jgi:nicotinamide-nucleotide amidase
MVMNDALTDRIGNHLQERHRTLAVAESLTGGMLSQRFAKASASSEWFLGGLVAYSRSVKHQVLHVPDGPVVSEQAALAMARGAARLMGATVGVAVTGVGGPAEQDGQPPGTVWIATWPPDLGEAVLLRLEGDPPAICEQASAEAVRILAARLGVAV